MPADAFAGTSWAARFDALDDPVSVLRAVRDTRGAIVDLEIAYANPAWHRTLGSRAGIDLTGRRLIAHMPSAAARLELYRMVIDTGVPARLVVEDAAGGRRYDVTYRRHGDGLIAVNRDITGEPRT